jgi:phosphopantothenoylcysteine decarboxylase
MTDKAFAVAECRRCRLIFALDLLADANDEWSVWNRMGDEVVHIALRDWADVLVVAPLSANTLAKLSHGLCDDTLSCVVRAWDFGHRDDNGTRGKPLVLAPAMNTTMWHHPLTRQQLEQIQSWHVQNGVVVVPPQAKQLACGDVGVGAMADLAVITQAVQDVLQRQAELPP